MNKPELHIVHIYPNEMNTYGDRGNLMVLQKRALRHGLKPIIHYYSVGDTFPEADLVLGGGGQDSAQADIQADILRIGDKLRNLVEHDVPMLMVCGTYQLFGNRFVTFDGREIRGISIFDMETIGGSKRMIGNIAVDTETWGTLYGFENHSGQTTLGQTQQPLGKVSKGGGNNSQNKTEGARTHNAIGTYMHGPMLPNNPRFADWMITEALRQKGVNFKPAKLDDTLATRARQNAAHRPY
jgi:CobQ-like glutamine amidotransferase family enzyme